MMIGTKEEMDEINIQHLKKKGDFILICQQLLSFLLLSVAFIIPTDDRSFYHFQQILPEDIMAL